MTRVAPMAQHELMLYHTLRTQARLLDWQLQLGSGKVSQQYSGIANQSSRLVSLETSTARAAQYVANIDFFDHRLALVDLSLETIDTAARDVRAALNSVVNFPDSHANDLRQSAADASDLVRDMLNTRDGARYLFAGTRIDQQPVSLGAGYASVRLIEADGVTVDETFYQSHYTNVLGNVLPYAQGSFYQQIYFEKNGVLPAGPLPGDLNNPTLTEFVAEDPALWTYYVGRLNSTQMVANPKLDYYSGDQQNQTVRVGDTLEVKLDVRADDVALQQILLALDTIANLPDDVPNSSFEQEIVAKARDILNKALGSDPSAGYPNLQALRGDVNSVRERIANTRGQHESFLAYAEGAIGDIENIDAAEVIVRLQNDQLILQAAYSAIAELRSLSLLNYL